MAGVSEVPLYVDRDVDPAFGPGADPGAEPGRVLWTHSGYRYALGYVHEHYGIFDKETWQAGPILAFPGTDEGWEEALAKFEELEPGGWVTVVEI